MIDDEMGIFIGVSVWLTSQLFTQPRRVWDVSWKWTFSLSARCQDILPIDFLSHQAEFIKKYI